MDLRPAAYAVIVQDGNVLMSHWVGIDDRGGAWTLPGGGLDAGEHPEDGAIRETLEETGYTIRLTGLLGIDSVVIPAHERAPGHVVPIQGLRFVYVGEVVSGDLTIEEDGSSDDAAWVPINELAYLKRTGLVDFAFGRFYANPEGAPLAGRHHG